MEQATTYRLGRGEMALLAFVALAALGAGWSAALWQERIVLACPFLALTGHPCPTCGGTRAMVAVAQGRLLQGLAYNPLVAAGGAMLWLWLPAAVAVCAGWLRPPRLPTRITARWRWAVLLLLAANWVYLWLTWS